MATGDAMDCLGETPSHVFGRLVPFSGPAKAAFSKIVETMVSNSVEAETPTTYVHASQYVRAKKEVSDSGDSSSQDESVRPAASGAVRKPRYTGSYILSLEIAPGKGPDWVLGSTRGEGWEEEVDLLLDMGEDHYACGRHATIFFHPESWQLTLHAIHPTCLSGRGGGVELHKQAHKELENHKRIMEKIGSHEIIIRLVETFCDFKSEQPGAYCVYSPLVTGNWLQGIKHLHAKRFMHRDLSWNNIGTLLGPTPKGVLLDLDKATDRASSKDWKQGTVCFNAPEMVRLRRSIEDGIPEKDLIGYGKAVDIWALGICGTLMIKGREPLWWTYDEEDDQPDANDLKSKLNANEVTRDRHKKYVDSLGLDLKAIGNTPLQGRMLHLFTSMAFFNDSDRPTTGIAFNHVDSMFKKISLNDVAIPPKSGVKRSRNEH
ncbi:MAG: hypothetical protein Q9194_002497 [Teloschistes cf. exilis]